MDNDAVENGENDFETERFCVFAAPGSLPAHAWPWVQLRNPGLFDFPVVFL
jgi:hypothetical protein